MAAWVRDAVVVVGGHTSGCVKAAVKRKADCEMGSQDATLHRRIPTSAMKQYLETRARDPAAAESLLSKFFERADAFSLQLMDDRGFPLSDAGMLEALVEDMFARADNSFPFDHEFSRETDLRVSRYRALGVDQNEQAVVGPFSMEDLNSCLQKIGKSKKCLKVSFDVVLSKNSEMRRLTLGLANLALHVGLTSSLWSLRQFAHLRKSGPHAVRSIKCLRPVSLVSDMAHVVDGLWIARNKRLLEYYAGPCQLGGVFAAIFVVLTLVILAEARDHLGLATYLVALDLQWAFDVATLNGMRLACAEAGLTTESWLFLDDILTTDQQCVQLHGLLSKVFVLGCRMWDSSG